MEETESACGSKEEGWGKGSGRTGGDEDICGGKWWWVIVGGDVVVVGGSDGA